MSKCGLGVDIPEISIRVQGPSVTDLAVGSAHFFLLKVVFNFQSCQFCNTGIYFFSAHL